MSLLSATCRVCRSRVAAAPTAGPSCSFASSSKAWQDSPLPARDWSKPPGLASPRNHRNRQSSKEPKKPQPVGARGRRGVGVPKIGWNGAVKHSSFGLRNENNSGTETHEKKDDLATSLLKWNTSAASPATRSGDDEDRSRRHEPRSSSLTAGEFEADAEDRHGRRLKPGERTRESRGFESLRRTSGDGEIMLNRNIRHGPKKGKEREHEQQRYSPRESTIRKADKPRRTVEKAKEAEKEVYIPSTVTVSRLADIFGVKIFHLQSRMMRLGLSEDQRRADFFLTAEQACDIALEYGFNPTIDDERSFDILPELDPVGDNDLPLRPPVVAIMGHVDHGKTTLLDSLRHTSVAAGEAGGITQHIGAFSVPLSSLVATTPSTSESTITFLDTPGHAAFTAMRARGASVTDIVVLVVAADDGVMPQTKEVLELVKSENDRVGLVVAINKCDKPGLDFKKVKSALGAEGILLEEDGGDVPSVKVSGLAKIGLDSLVETLSTIAEVRDLRGRRDGQVQGYVLESRVDRGRGNVATVLVTRGTLSAGDVIVAGNTWARVRQMQDSQSRPIKSAAPGTPVSITGWKDLPAAGDQLLEAKDEDTAKKAITNRIREIERKKMMADVEIINAKRKEERLRAEKEAAEEEAILAAGGTPAQVQAAEKLAAATAASEARDGFKELRLVIKADVSGTVEAVVGSLEGIGNKEAGVKIVHTGVGEVSESDISLAEAANATVIGFSVACPRSIQNHAKSANVPLHLESVIYRLIETVRTKVAGLLPPTIESRVTGEAVVQQLFPIKVKKETLMVAGCRVSNGVINKAEKVRVLRPSATPGGEREVVFEGTIETLRHLKKEVGEVRKGTECGISFEGFTDVKEGDEVVTFTTFEVPREL